MSVTAVSFIGSLIIFTLIGIASTFKSQKNVSDYLIASKSIPPWLVGLSGVATNTSGFMFVGVMGYAYTDGLQAVWVVLVWMIGDLISSFIVHKRLRKRTEEIDASTYPEVMSNWNGENYVRLRKIMGAMIVAFLGTYAAAQLSAGGKALYSVFDWNYNTGAIIGSVIVLLYCFAGGIRASIWTDAAQSFVMIGAMGVMAYVAMANAGGASEFFTKVDGISDTYLNLFPSDLLFGAFIGGIIFALSWLSAGFGVIGQPHIMVRFMTMKKVEDMARVRFWYFSWYSFFGILVMIVGFAGRVYIPDTGDFDSELALPILAGQMLPEVMVGLVLAGLFAATMSTADSQILSCSAAITRDLKIGKKDSYIATKLGTVFVTITALLIALYGSDSVFTLVLVAWSALAAAFAPLLLVLCFGGKPSEKLSITICLTGLLVAIIWKFTGLGAYAYETLPGILSGLIAYFALRKAL